MYRRHRPNRTLLTLQGENNTGSTTDGKTECDRQPVGHPNTEQEEADGEAKGAKKPYNFLN